MGYILAKCFLYPQKHLAKYTPYAPNYRLPHQNCCFVLTHCMFCPLFLLTLSFSVHKTHPSYPTLFLSSFVIGVLFEKVFSNYKPFIATESSQPLKKSTFQTKKMTPQFKSRFFARTPISMKFFIFLNIFVHEWRIYFMLK